MSDVDTNSTPVPKPTLSNGEREKLDGPVRLVKELEVAPESFDQAVGVTLKYSVLHGPGSWSPEMYVLSLPAAALLARQLKEAVDECLYRSDGRN